MAQWDYVCLPDDLHCTYFVGKMLKIYLFIFLLGGFDDKVKSNGAVYGGRLLLYYRHKSKLFRQPSRVIESQHPNAQFIAKIGTSQGTWTQAHLYISYSLIYSIVRLEKWRNIEPKKKMDECRGEKWWAKKLAFFYYLKKQSGMGCSNYKIKEWKMSLNQSSK